VLPIALVISQYISTAILTPKTDDPQQQQSQAILKFLPLMIGWFSLNVPSGLGLYWMTNNVVTTLTTVLIRKSVGTPALVDGMDSGPAIVEPPKAQGFGRQYGEVLSQKVSTADDGTKVTISPPGTKSAQSTVVEATVVESAVAAAPAVADSAVVSSESALKKKKRSKKKKKKN